MIKDELYNVKKYIDLIKKGYIVKEGENYPKEKKNSDIKDSLKNKLCLNTSSECPIIIFAYQINLLKKYS